MRCSINLETVFPRIGWSLNIYARELIRHRTPTRFSCDLLPHAFVNRPTALRGKFSVLLGRRPDEDAKLRGIFQHIQFECTIVSICLARRHCSLLYHILSDTNPLPSFIRSYMRIFMEVPTTNRHVPFFLCFLSNFPFPSFSFDVPRKPSTVTVVDIRSPLATESVPVSLLLSMHLLQT
jgi:hypothetical protein